MTSQEGQSSGAGRGYSLAGGCVGVGGTVLAKMTSIEAAESGNNVSVKLYVRVRQHTHTPLIVSPLSFVGFQGKRLKSGVSTSPPSYPLRSPLLRKA